MSSVVISGDTSGAITLSAPAVAGTNTITLPASTGTVLTTGSPQSGGVLQVVQGSTTTRVQISTSTYTDTNLTVSITPKFATSKILVLVSQNIGSYCGDNAGVSGGLRIVRDSTTVFTSASVINARAGLGSASELRIVGQYSFIYLDSPSTTSSTTYKTQASLESGTGRIEPQSNSGSSNSTITLMEIAG